jgi:plastocyanin
MNKRRYVVASVIAVAGFASLFAVLPSKGAGREVVMSGNQYRPATVRIPVGGAITFTNEDRVTHTATCQGAGCPKDSGDIQPGLFKTLTFTRAGTFHMVCRYHGEAGMIATVTVGGAPPKRSSPSPSPSTPVPSATPTATPTS